MRKVAVLLVALGAVGLIVGAVAIVRNTTGPTSVPFSHENYGGPGPILGAIILLCGGMYLLSVARKED